MSHQIIVGVDPHRVDDTAPLALAALLGRATGAPLLVVSVYADQTTGTGLSLAERDRLAREDALNGLGRVLEHAGADDSELHGVPYATEAVAGSSFARGLHEVAERERATLLVVGATHRGAIGRVIPGSVTERVVQGSPCAVAVSPQGFQDAGRPLQRVGLAYVSTREGRQALQAAALLASRSACKLRAMTVVDRFLYPSLPPVESAADVGPLAERAESELDRDLRRIAPDVPAEVVAITRGGIDELIERSRDLDLLVCGSRGYGPLKAVLLGGVSHVLMQRSACPLLVIPRGVEQALAPLLEQSTAVGG